MWREIEASAVRVLQRDCVSAERRDLWDAEAAILAVQVKLATRRRDCSVTHVVVVDDVGLRVHLDVECERRGTSP